MAHARRKLLGLLSGQQAQPSAVILDGRTLRSTPESGSRAGDHGGKRTKGAKVHAAVDTPGPLLALKVTAASEQERAPAAALVKDLQETTHEPAEVAFADPGYPGEDPADQAAQRGVRLVVVKLDKARKALSFCPGAGWSNAPLPGAPASVASPEITNVCLPPSQDFIGSLSLRSCSIPSPVEGHDTLEKHILG